MAEPYEVRRIEEIEPIGVSTVDMAWRPIRRTLGITAFAINAYTGDTGRDVVEPHTEGALRHEKVYVVLRGLARFTLGEDEVVAGSGTLVYVRDPDTTRGAVALEDGTTVLEVGGRPGAALEPAARKRSSQAAPRYESSNIEAVLASIREELQHKPDHALMLYEVACYEAVLGRRDDALATLRRATERDARTAEWARHNDHFSSLQDDPEFLAITGQSDPAGSSA
jgi:hypothetical protein